MTSLPSPQAGLDGLAPAPRFKLSLRDLVLYGIVVLSWSFTWIAMKMQLGVVAPEISLVWRFVVAAALMWAWVLARGERVVWPLSAHLRFAGLGLFLFSGNFTLFYHGAQYLPSGLLAVIFSLASIVNLTLGWLVLRQPMERAVALGGLMGLAGIALMFWPQIAGSGFDRAALTGLALCCAGTLFFCSGNLVSTAAQRRGLPVLPATAWGMTYGALYLSAFGLARGQAFIVEWTPAYLGSLAFLAIVGSVIAFAAYLTLLGRIGQARAGYATVLFPVIALIVSTIVENYVWTWPAVIGLVLVLAGNVVLLRR